MPLLYALDSAFWNTSAMGFAAGPQYMFSTLGGLNISFMLGNALCEVLGVKS